VTIDSAVNDGTVQLSSSVWATQAWVMWLLCSEIVLVTRLVMVLKCREAVASVDREQRPQHVLSVLFTAMNYIIIL